MTKAKIHAENLIKTTMEYLSKEQKQEVNEKVELYREMCLDCFFAPQGGKAIQKIPFPRLLLQGEIAMTTADMQQCNTKKRKRLRS
jgi:hypothetical protein